MIFSEIKIFVFRIYLRTNITIFRGSRHHFSHDVTFVIVA